MSAEELATVVCGCFAALDVDAEERFGRGEWVDLLRSDAKCFVEYVITVCYWLRGNRMTVKSVDRQEEITVGIYISAEHTQFGQPVLFCVSDLLTAKIRLPIRIIPAGHTSHPCYSEEESLKKATHLRHAL